ncbi:MAG: hypothetical protein J6K57_00640 [Alistipes sp.]|nr:hypothetical protein [Alistipes sp.]MBQ7952924.1 hypothetical protein [Alistipes sp.]
MVLSLIIFGLLSGSLFSVLIGILGASRKIGFGWSFILSLLLTPIGGLICVLISDPLPTGERKWGCLANLILIAAIAMLVMFVLAVLGTLTIA